MYYKDTNENVEAYTYNSGMVRENFSMPKLTKSRFPKWLMVLIVLVILGLGGMLIMKLTKHKSAGTTEQRFGYGFY